MFETSFQAKFLIPMAVTLTFGLAFATVLTLVIVPTLNMIFFDLRGLFRHRKNEKLYATIEEDLSQETESFPEHDYSSNIAEKHSQ